MKISVIGTGYVGLVTGACLADMGNEVLCLDVDVEKINRLRKGIIPFYEPGLDTLVTRNVSENRLFFTTDPQEAGRFGQVQMIAVGTPPGEDGSADLQYVLAAAKAIGEAMDGYRVIVNKSTVPVGTADQVSSVIDATLKARGLTHPFHVVSNPEFLKEGSAIADFMRPDRIVVGCDDAEVESVMRAIYAPFQRSRDKLVMMDVRSAELTKYAANTMLATRISFMNELARLAEVLGADIEEVRRGIGSDPRIGNAFLYAGCGYGGSCLPKDVSALRRMFAENSLDCALMDGVDYVNEQQKSLLLDRVVMRFGNDLSQHHFAIWGLAFKPNTDDVRAAPSQIIVAGLLERGAKVTAFDPIARETFGAAFGHHDRLTYGDNPYDVLAGADGLLIVTEWHLFRTPDFDRIKSLLKRPVIIDGRNLFEPDLMQTYGMEYVPIGRKPS